MNAHPITRARTKPNGHQPGASLVDHLLKSLNDEGIQYCHWKSNVDLDKATSGELDLDFLIDRESYQSALAVLSKLGFKPALIQRGQNVPGISHFYGYDPLADRFAHVHLFSRVMTGESYVKSHLLPFETMLLENIRHEGQMPVTSQSAELVLFTIRTFIKYGSLLDLVALSRKPEKVKSELAWLRTGSDDLVSKRLLATYCPVVDEDLFDQCLNSIEQDAPLIERIRLARQLRKHIQSYAGDSLIGRFNANLRFGMIQIRRRFGKKKKNKVLQSGGAVIAIVGPDATGKSTMVAETSRWLRQNFAVNTIHAGKPPSAWITAPVNLLFHLFRRLKPNRQSAAPQGPVMRTQAAAANGKGTANLLYALRAVTLAYDRRKLLLKAWRAAAHGEIVVCDRYPSSSVGAMDSPRLVEPTGSSGWLTPLYNLAVRLERHLYRQIPPPDIVIRLNVSVETAIERNRRRGTAGEEPDEYIAARHQHAPAWQRDDACKVFDVDTEQSLPKTIMTVKDIIWRIL